MVIASQRIRQALKTGKEIEVVERGGDQVMTAFEHPYATGYNPYQETSLNAKGSDESQRNVKKASCYWYSGDKKYSAVFNLENLSPVY